MSDHTEDTLQTDALEAEVAELLDEVEKKAVAVEARLGAGDDPVVNELLDEVGAASAAAATLDQDVDALIAEAERQTHAGAAHDEDVDALIEAVETEVAAGAGADADNGADVAPEPTTEADTETTAAEPVPEDEIEPEAAPETEPEPEPEVEAEVEVEADAAPSEEPSVESIDASDTTDTTDEAAPEEPTAEETASKPLGEVMDPSDEIDLSAPSPSPDAAPEPEGVPGALDDELAAEADDAIGSEIAGEVETVDLGEALAAHDTEVAEVTEPATPTPKEVAVADSAEAVEENAQAGAAPARWVMLLGMLATSLRLLSSPMERLSVRQRDTVGWIAINLAFIAFCVWLYTLLR